MVKKSLLLAGVFATLGVVSLAGIGAVSAQSDRSNGSTLAEKIAQKFNLNKDEVQQVLKADREEKQSEHKAKQEERLNNAVTNGKLTEEQKTKILDRMKEMQQAREQNKDNMKSMSDEERHAFMKDKREALDAWAKENNIPKEYMSMAGPHGPGHHGPRSED